MTYQSVIKSMKKIRNLAHTGEINEAGGHTVIFLVFIDNTLNATCRIKDTMTHGH